MSPKTEQLIVKFLCNQASLSELDELAKWIVDSDNESIFNKYVKLNYAIEYNMMKFDSKDTKKKLLALIESEKKVAKRIKMRKLVYYAAAAVFIGVLASAYYLKVKSFNHQEKIVPTVVNTIETGTDKAILTLEDGSEVALEKGNNFNTGNVNSDGEQIIYKDSEKHSKVIVYNYLTIPRGGQFFIKLSDGTQVWLNSESKLKYPTSFIDGEMREVELVYGEAYFDVSPSTEHKGAKFKVLNQSQDIEVVGTQFNLKAYQDEPNVYTTLVEGKVLINTAKTTQELKPSQQSNLNINDNNIEIAKVNVFREISWKEGVFSFRKKPLVEIMKVLSRWYDMDVVFENPDVENIGFNGVLGKDQEIEDILNSIKNFGVITNYEIKNKRVIIK
jgi:transmembrane sensor